MRMRSAQDAQKHAAARHALRLVRPHMKLGLGTGSTAEYFIAALAHRVRTERLPLICAASSQRSHALGARLGLRFAPLHALQPLDLVVDGADELTDPSALIKGGGGAMLRERTLVRAARAFVVIADASKKVRHLGAFPLPIELARDSHARLAAGVRRALRLPPAAERVRRQRSGALFITDLGHVLYDYALGRIAQPRRLARRLEALPGVRAHGLFLDMASAAIIAHADGRIEWLGRRLDGA